MCDERSEIEGGGKRPLDGVWSSAHGGEEREIPATAELSSPAVGGRRRPKKGEKTRECFAFQTFVDNYHERNRGCGVKALQMVE
jgi:hypothetical protein